MAGGTDDENGVVPYLEVPKGDDVLARPPEGVESLAIGFRVKERSVESRGVARPRAADRRIRSRLDHRLPKILTCLPGSGMPSSITNWQQRASSPLCGGMYSGNHRQAPASRGTLPRSSDVEVVIDSEARQVPLGGRRCVGKNRTRRCIENCSQGLLSIRWWRT